jgi:hypothetical protein
MLSARDWRSDDEHSKRSLILGVEKPSLEGKDTQMGSGPFILVQEVTMNIPGQANIPDQINSVADQAFQFAQQTAPQPQPATLGKKKKKRAGLAALAKRKMFGGKK